MDKQEKEKTSFADIDDNGNLNDVEIMSTGTWKGWKFTEADLDDMEKNFSAIPLKVAMKLGHKPDQKDLWGDGAPAIGWVSKVKRVGQKLFASFTDIPVKLVELIKKKNFIRFSSEVRRDFSFNNQVYKNVLSAVAILGERFPAVQTLDDIYNLHAANAANYSDVWPEGQAVIICSDEEKIEKGEIEMAEIDVLKGELEKKTQELAKLSEAAKENEKKIAELQIREKAFSDDAKRKSIYAVIDEGIRTFKIAPIAREYFAAVALKAEGLEEKSHEFSQDGKIVKIESESVAELFQKFFSAMPAIGKAEEKSEERTEQDVTKEVKVGSRTYDTGEDLDIRIRAKMNGTQMTYSEAFEIVADEIATEDRKKEAE